MSGSCQGERGAGQSLVPHSTVAIHSFVPSFTHAFICSARLCEAPATCQGRTQTCPPSGSCQPLGAEEASQDHTDFKDRLGRGQLLFSATYWGARAYGMGEWQQHGLAWRNGLPLSASPPHGVLALCPPCAHSTRACSGGVSAPAPTSRFPWGHLRSALCLALGAGAGQGLTWL